MQCHFCHEPLRWNPPGKTKTRTDINKIYIYMIYKSTCIIFFKYSNIFWKLLYRMLLLFVATYANLYPIEIEQYI